MIYLDAASTTKPYGAALTRFHSVNESLWFNPSSTLYSSLSADILGVSRKEIANILGCEPEQILFTSGATEAANWVLSQGWHNIYTSQLEHPCVYNAATRYGSFITRLANDNDGVVALEFLNHELSLHHCFGRNLVCVMGASNEIGTIQPIKEIAQLVHDYQDTCFFCDATQLWPHEPIDLDGIDFACMSAHKFGGLKGTGFLYVKEPELLQPLLLGGHQEFGLRAGTENVGGIYAMAEALKVTARLKSVNKTNASAIRKQIMSHAGYRYNGSVNNSVQNIVSLTMPDCDAQQMVAALAKEDIYLSAGSACNTGSAEPSRALTAIGLTAEEARRTLRISFDARVRDSDIEQVFDRILYYREVLRE